MKRTVSLLLTLLLALCAANALAARYEVAGLYSVDCGSYAIDTTAYREEPDWLFMVYSRDVLIDAYRAQTRDYDPSLTLIDPSVEQLRDVQAEYLDIWQDSSPRYMKFLKCENGVTFLIFTLKDEIGTYLAAETAARGYSISFTAQYRDESPADDLLLQELEKLLLTYEPDK